jgi:manganese transport protein
MSEYILTDTTVVDGLSERTETHAREVLAGRRRGWRAVLPFAGPAVIASIAYMDPGNFATNIQAGAGYGYLLLWVVLLANILAMIFQALSARMGIATGTSLAGLCREHFPRPVVLAMWVVSEIGAMATDLAELLGAAIGLSLLTGAPLVAALIVAGLGTWIMLSWQGVGFRRAELLIGGFVGIICVCYLLELMIAPPEWPAFFGGTFVPRLAGPETLTLAVGIVGASVMPHAIYLHSSLTQNRIRRLTQDQQRRVIRFSDREVMVALGVAGLVNMAMLAMAAVAFHQGHSDVAEIETAYHTLTPLLGGMAAVVFMTSLLASGFSASVVGTMAGQVIMQDFIRMRVPLWVRRAATMIPAFAVIAAGMNSTHALVLSQVVLSMVLPVPVIALLILVRRRDVMGNATIGPRFLALAWAAAGVVLALNVLLLLQTAGVTIPGLG